MPERPLSEEMRDWITQPNAFEEMPAQEFERMADRVAALEADNARLREVYEAAVAWYEGCTALADPPEAARRAHRLLDAVREARDA